MALNDIVVDQNDKRQLVLELPSKTYTGKLKDISPGDKNETSNLIYELVLSPVQINNSRRKVR